MFYALSKIIGLAINPLIWILTLLFLAFTLRSSRLKKTLFTLALIFTVFFSNSFILNEFLKNWEPKGVEIEELKPKYDYGIVLSGMVWYDTDSKRLNFMKSSDRIWQAVRLYEKGIIDKILITGGAASYFQKDTVESVLLKGFLEEIGITSNDIVIETQARNTRENAYYTAELLKNRDYNNLLLITSASHMPRSIRCFESVGLRCDTFPTDHYSGARKFNIETLLIPNAQTLANWNIIIHEWFGMLSYKIAGYI